jgi:hypothetical protein
MDRLMGGATIALGRWATVPVRASRRAIKNDRVTHRRPLRPVLVEVAAGEV